MKGFLSALLLLLSVACLNGQNTYTIGSIPFQPDPFNTGTSTGINVDDGYGAVVPLPFSFCFYDQSYSNIVIGSNGTVTFDLSMAGQYCPWPIGVAAPSTVYTDKSIMAPMQDLNPSMGGSIKYAVHGVAPYRRFVISYFEVPMYSCTSLLFSEQVILYETTNIIETHILDKPLCLSWNNGAAIHGIQVDPMTGFVVPGRNFGSQWATSSEGFRFTPTGTCAGLPPANSVNGRVYADYNHNCILDVNEFPIKNRAILANGGQFYGWTDANGYYNMGLAAGSYTIEEYLTAPYYVSNCVPGGAYQVTLSGTVVNNADFADSVGVICSDLTVDVGTTPMRRCATTYAGITYCNQGTYPDSNVVVTVQLIDSLTILSASMGYTALGANAYAFQVGTLLPGQCGTIQLFLEVGCDSVGVEYCISASIIGTYPTECDYQNNSGSECQVLVAAMDPNEKRVASQDGHGYVIYDEMDAQDALTYSIHFQNLGTSYAEDVEIRDTLDAAQLRLETFQAGAGIAPYQYVLVGNVAIFRFEDILLPAASVDEPASHGFVKFSIEQQPGHGPGTVIHNRAAIYFDQEPAVVTNQTTNLIPLVIGADQGQQAMVRLYPNPGQNELVVQLDAGLDAEFLLYDLTGKEVCRMPLRGSLSVVPTGGLQEGIYLYRVMGDGLLLKAGKWVKQ